MTSTSIASESESFSEYENININIKCEISSENCQKSEGSEDRIKKNAETEVSNTSAPLPAFSLAGEKKFEKMRDVKVKDSKTIHIYISLVK